MADPRYEIGNPQIKKLLLELGHKMKADMPEGWGFTLLMFTYGEDGALFYISSARRDDMVKTMKEFIAGEEKHG